MAQDIFDEPLFVENTVSQPVDLQELEASASHSMDDNTPELRDIPPIRDNPEMQRTTAKRRSSVAHPHSIKYMDPTRSHDDVSPNQSSSSDEAGDDEDSEDELHFSATNENRNINRHHAQDPSISDLNEITPIRENPEEEEVDPFARLGYRQHSVALPPDVRAIAEQQRIQEQIKQAQLAYNAPNPYTPEAILEPKHLYRHSRGASKHSRSQTLVPGMRQAHMQQHSLRTRAQQRHNHSSSVDWSEQMLGPPSGPDLTFLCMKIENRTVLQDALSDKKYLQIMEIHNVIFTEAMNQFNGHCIEQNNGHVYDILTVFNDIYDAMRCAINIQRRLNQCKWPSFYYELERNSARMSYVGTGKKGAFNGLRVGMALHTASVGREINKYDGGKETLEVTTIIFDATYKGTAVDIVKALCIRSYGGELLATKASYQALLRSKKSGDEISVQILGVCILEDIRSVELIQIIPRDLPYRQYPPRSYIRSSNKHRSLSSTQIKSFASSTVTSYDPFPPPDPEDEDEDDDDDGIEENDTDYDTMNEMDQEHDSHSSNNDEIQHKPPRRRPSITQFVAGPNSQIEVSFNATGTDDEDEDNLGYHIKYNENLLEVEYKGSIDMDSDHSIDPPVPHSTRSKAQEIKVRKSMKHSDDITNSLIKELPTKAQRKKEKISKYKKRKLNRKPSGRDGDDESTPLPGDVDYDGMSMIIPITNIAPPTRAPRANKKAEHFDTMVGIKFDPDDDSIYSGGSRSIRTSTSIKSRILNPEQQLKLCKMRPLSLPSAYNDDKEFTCLCCQENKKWTDGVWRVPMWPSFDICIRCGNKALQTGTSKKAMDNFNPQSGATNMGNDVLFPSHSSTGSTSKHRKVPSNQPLMKDYIDGIAAAEAKMSQEALEMLRKELSYVIEDLTNERLRRLDNLSNWAKTDAEFEQLRNQAIAERKTTEDEIKVWRTNRNRLDAQDQRVFRRRNTVNEESPHASDLESDEELHKNWQDYDYNEDFLAIRSIIGSFEHLFWTEDKFFRKRFENELRKSNNKIKQLQQGYAQTTHQLQQRNDELSHRINTLIRNEDHDNESSAYNDKYHNILNNGDDIDDYSEDDLENVEQYAQYEPPSVKHIHQHSAALNDTVIATQLAQDIADGDELHVFKHKIGELNTQIDNYISTVNRKDRQIREHEQSLEELKQKVNYLENMNDTEEQFAELHRELQATKDENMELQSKLKMYIYDEPSQHAESEQDSFSNLLFDDFSVEQKDIPMDMDMDQEKENEIRLKAANVRIDKLGQNMDTLKDENERLTQSKHELLNRTSEQIEKMRDELQTMCQQLHDKDNQIRRLIHPNKEGYDPEHDQKIDTNVRLSLSNSLLGNSVNGLWTYGRSKFSSSFRTLTQTKQSKIDLAVSTAFEIERLRDIIKALSTGKGTTYGDTDNRRSPSVLLGVSDPGSY